MVVVHIISCTFDQARSQGGAGGQVHPPFIWKGVQWRICTHPIRHILKCGCLCVRRWHGNASTRKRNKNYIWGISVFLEIRVNPSKVQNCGGISEYFVSISQYLELNGFLFFWSISSLGLFPHIFYPFPFFSKTLKISFCWSIFSNFRSVSSYFWSVQAFFQKF